MNRVVKKTDGRCNSTPWIYLGEPSRTTEPQSAAAACKSSTVRAVRKGGRGEATRQRQCQVNSKSISNQ